MSGATKLMTAGGGGVSLTPASSIASDVTVNVPSQNCTLGIQGPAFKAYAGTTQSISKATWTKIQYQTITFDTASCFDTANYRFTPNVAGYYYITGTVNFSSTTSSSNWGVMALRVNGSDSSYSPDYSGTANGMRFQHSGLVYLNGSTDYVEMAIYQSSGSSQTASGNLADTNFQGFLARSA